MMVGAGKARNAYIDEFANELNVSSFMVALIRESLEKWTVSQK